MLFTMVKESTIVWIVSKPFVLSVQMYTIERFILSKKVTVAQLQHNQVLKKEKVRVIKERDNAALLGTKYKSHGPTV